MCVFSHYEWWFIVNDRVCGHQRLTGGWISFSHTHTHFSTRILPNRIRSHILAATDPSFLSISYLVLVILMEKRKEDHVKRCRSKYLKTRTCSTANNRLNTDLHVVVSMYSKCRGIVSPLALLQLEQQQIRSTKGQEGATWRKPLFKDKREAEEEKPKKVNVTN